VPSSQSAYIALALSTSLAFVACSDDAARESVVWTAEPIIGGSLASTEVAVVAVKQTSTGALCSGTLVAPNIVLTAAHCVYGVSPTDLEVLVGVSTNSPDQTIGVANAIAYPTYQGEVEGVLGGVDLGAITLATPLMVPPIAARTDTTDTELTNAAITLVGYGADDGTTSSGVGIRRSVIVETGSVCSRLVRAGNADANACFGDSGGAVLLGGSLVAVISGGGQGCYAPTELTRLDAHADWITEVLANGTSAPCTTCVAPDPACGAATETRAATTSDAGESDAATDAPIDASTPPTDSGGCATTPQPSRGDAFAIAACVIAIGAIARRRSGSLAR
jgi:V8-like Glu-specific endopeptidase